MPSWLYAKKRAGKSGNWKRLEAQGKPATLSPGRARRKGWAGRGRKGQDRACFECMITTPADNLQGTGLDAAVLVGGNEFLGICQKLLPYSLERAEESLRS